jgi:hypothetical protein
MLFSSPCFSYGSGSFSRAWACYFFVFFPLGCFNFTVTKKLAAHNLYFYKGKLFVPDLKSRKNKRAGPANHSLTTLLQK